MKHVNQTSQVIESLNSYVNSHIFLEHKHQYDSRVHFFWPLKLNGLFIHI